MNSWVYIHSGFSNFTTGCIYNCFDSYEVSTKIGYLRLIGDNGELSTPSVCGWNGPNNFIVYFMPLYEWRCNRIDSILDNSIGIN